MKKKYFYVILILFAFIVGYVIYKTVIFNQHFNKLEASNAKPSFTLEQLLNHTLLKTDYIKSFNYDKKCIAFNAIVNGKYYITVTKLGHVKNTFLLQKTKDDFSKNSVIGFPPVDFEEQGARYINFEDYPFDIKKNIQYYIKGKEIEIINNRFQEIIYNGSYINISFNDKNKSDFSFVTSNRDMSVSFINYKNELYVINTKAYKNYPFVNLHTILSN